MMVCLKKIFTIILVFLSTEFVFLTAFASQTYTNSDSFLSRLNPKNATIVFQLGAFRATQGSTQDIGIDGLIGDHFTLAHHYAQNSIVGLGYYFNGISQNRLGILYGLNAYYLAHTSVQGNVIQEGMFNNLSYQYSIVNYPIYAAIKALINSNNDKYTLTVDAGVGPNFIKTRNFGENSLDGGITIPDNAFAGKTTSVLSATAGIGIRFNNLIHNIPLEIGYRFFYLGQANLQTLNSEIINSFSTGNNFANAIIVSVNV